MEIRLYIPMYSATMILEEEERLFFITITDIYAKAAWAKAYR